MYYLFQTLFLFLRIMNGALIAYVVLSWIAPRSSIHGFLARFVEPFVRPFRMLTRRLLGRFALPVDFSVFFAMIGVEVIRALLVRLYIALL